MWIFHFHLPTATITTISKMVEFDILATKMARKSRFSGGH